MAYANPEKIKHSSFAMDAELYRQFKIALAYRGQKMNDFIRESVQNLVAEQNRSGK